MAITAMPARNKVIRPIYMKNLLYKEIRSRLLTGPRALPKYTVSTPYYRYGANL